MQAPLIGLLLSCWLGVVANSENPGPERPRDSTDRRYPMSRRDQLLKHNEPVLVRRGGNWNENGAGNGQVAGASPDSNKPRTAFNWHEDSGIPGGPSKKQKTNSDEDRIPRVPFETLEGRTRLQKMKSLRELSSPQLPPDPSKMKKGTRTPRPRAFFSSDTDAKSSEQTGSSAQPGGARKFPSEIKMPTKSVKSENVKGGHAMSRWPSMSFGSGPSLLGLRDLKMSEMSGTQANSAKGPFDKATKLALWETVIHQSNSQDPQLRRLHHDLLARTTPEDRHHMHMALALHIEPFTSEYDAFVAQSVATARKENSRLPSAKASTDAEGHPHAAKWVGPPLKEQVHFAYAHGLNSEEEFPRYQERTKRAMMKGINPFDNERGRADLIAQSKSPGLRDVPLTSLYHVSSGEILDHVQKNNLQDKWRKQRK